MHIVCDFDGTISSRDTNSLLARTFAPRAFDALEGQLFAGTTTLRETLAGQWAEMTQQDEMVRCAVEQVPLRNGFADFVAACANRGWKLTVLSSGFRQVIEPMLAHAGVRGLRLIANDIDLTPGGGVATWRPLPMCAECGEPCKRHDVLALRAEVERPLVFVGDGISDWCGALGADVVFARDYLADQLQRVGRSFHPFDDFVDFDTAVEAAVTGWRPPCR